MNRYNIDKKWPYSKIIRMFLKRKIICALDKYEDLPPEKPELLVETNLQKGIEIKRFVNWFLEQPKNKKYGLSSIKKCIEDCRQDGFITISTVNGESYTGYDFDSDSSSSLLGMPKIVTKYYQYENICLTSAGRELKNWYFFYPAVLKKMSVWEIVIFGITTGIAIALAHLGLTS